MQGELSGTAWLAGAIATTVRAHEPPLAVESCIAVDHLILDADGLFGRPIDAEVVEADAAAPSRAAALPLGAGARAAPDAVLAPHHDKGALIAARFFFLRAALAA